MADSRDSLRAAVQRWRDTATLAPRLVGAGAIGLGVSALRTLVDPIAPRPHWRLLGEWLAQLLGRSGPVLAKLGQILATRADLLPVPVCQRLEALYACQRPMSRSQLRRLLRRAYPGGPPFAHFDFAPLAVGSIGEVHRARLASGERVVVKLVRPGIEAAIARDLNALRTLAELYFTLLGRRTDPSRALLTRALDDLAEGLALEPDLEREARALEEFRARQRNPRICIPRCYRELSSRQVLVLEELEGEPLADVRQRAEAEPEAARELAHLAFTEILTQVFRDGRFHADPHAGNLLRLPDGRLGLIDWGLTGSLAPQERARLTRAARAVLARDPDQAIRSLLEFGVLSESFDLQAFRRDVSAALGRHVHAAGGAGQAARRLEELTQELLRVAQRHQIYLPRSTALLIKSLVTIEGVARSLDPELNVLTTALPVVARALLPRFLRWDFWRERLRPGR
jgi:ubiquinone biosynthesis protein